MIESKEKITKSKKVNNKKSKILSFPQHNKHHNGKMCITTLHSHTRAGAHAHTHAHTHTSSQQPATLHYIYDVD